MKKSARIALVAWLTAFSVYATGTPHVVVMLGDSTTLSLANAPGAKLTDVVHANLVQRHLSTKVMNAGVGGDTAKGGFARLQRDVLAHEPAVVTVSFGLNDMSKLTPEQYREWMEKIVVSLQTNSRAKILLITSTPVINERHIWKKKFQARGGMDEYLDAHICSKTREIAKTFNLRLCDIHAHFLELFQKDPELRNTLIMPDGVHLTDQGNQVVAQFVAPALAEMLAATSTAVVTQNRGL